MIIAALLASLSIGLAGCTPGNETGRVLRFAFQNVVDHPQGLGAQRFAELVETYSNGELTVRLFPGGSLGGDLQTIAALRGGTLDVTVLNAGLLEGMVEEFVVFDFPFLFHDEREADAIVDGPFGQQLLQRLEGHGLVGLGYWDLGFRNITNNRRPIATADAIEGLKIRVLQSPIYIDLFNALGANAVPMPFPELYTAIETGAVDGQENPVTVIQGSRLNEVQQYLSLTRHTYNPQALLFSKRAWDRLSEEERRIIQQAAREATAFQRTLSRERQAEALAELEQMMLVNEVPAEEIERMRQRIQPTMERYRERVGASLMQQLEAELGAVRGEPTG